MELRQNYKEAKQKNREQSRKARQLLAAVTAKLQEKEDEVNKVSGLKFFIAINGLKS